MLSLPLYDISLFKAPLGIMSYIDFILYCFFWVTWDSIFMRKEEGGLGVRRLTEFNVAMLSKWCWRMMVDRVLVARYGVEGGRVKEG